MRHRQRSVRHSGLRQDEVDGAGASGSAQVLTATDEELSRPLIQVVHFHIFILSNFSENNGRPDLAIHNFRYTLKKVLPSVLFSHGRISAWNVSM